MSATVWGVIVTTMWNIFNNSKLTPERDFLSELHQKINKLKKNKKHLTECKPTEHRFYQNAMIHSIVPYYPNICISTLLSQDTCRHAVLL